MNQRAKNFLAFHTSKLAVTALIVLAIFAAITVKGEGTIWFCALAVLLVVVRVVLELLSFRQRRQLVAQLAAERPSLISPAEALARSRRQRIFIAGYCMGLAIPALAFVVLASVFSVFRPLGYFVAAGLGAIIVVLIVLGEMGVRRRAAATTEG